MYTLKYQTNYQSDIIDITYDVTKIVEKSGVTNGICYVYTPHTTCSIMVNENYDSDVKRDVVYKLSKLIERNDKNFRHAEGNSDSHIKAILCGNQKFFIIENGNIVLGQWEGIFLADFDGPRSARKVIIKVVNDNG